MLGQVSSAGQVYFLREYFFLSIVFYILVVNFYLFDDNIRYGRNHDFYKPAGNCPYGKTELV